MRNLTTLLLIGGLGFLLLVVSGGLLFGDPPMRVGQGIQAVAADQIGATNLVTAVVLV